MATTIDFIEFVCDQIRGSGAVRYKKMFGEYLTYVDERPALLVCDNMVFVKILPCLNEIMKDAQKGFPYNGAKEHYILDIDDSEKSRAVATLIAKNTPLKKSKRT